MQDIRFDGQVAVVTGGGAGLGALYARRLAERGASVIVNDLGVEVDGSGEPNHAADDTVALIEASGGRAVADRSDVADAAAAQGVIDTALSAFGRVDILMSNAGILRDTSFAKMPLEDFRAVIDVHLMGAVNLLKAAWPAMTAQGHGRVVLASSHAGLHGNFGQANYAAAKLGLIGLMNVLRLEGARAGILVNTLAPLAATRMAEASMLATIRGELDPEWPTAAALYLASKVNTRSGLIVTAGGGWLGRAAIVETPGVRLADPTPEAVAAQWNDAGDLGAARAYGEATDRLVEMFPSLRLAADVA